MVKEVPASSRQETYAELLRKAMRAKAMNRRELSDATGFSYEHIRKVVSGLPLMSEDFNEKVCKVLEIDQAAMWDVATREKMKRTYGAVPALAIPDARIKTLWTQLSAESQEKVVKIIEGLAVQDKISRDEHDTDDPEKIRERINELISRLSSIDRRQSSTADRKAAHR